MRHLYDSRTGERIRPAADKLRWAEHDLRYHERHLQEATAYSELTFWEKSRASFWTMWVSSAASIGFGLLQLRGVWADPSDISGAWAGLVFFALVAVFAAFSVGGKVGDHRGGADAVVRHHQADRDRHAERVERLKVDAAAEREEERAEEERIRNAPSPIQMLGLVVAAASRDTVSIDQEAPAWARALADTYSDEAWVELAEQQGWDSGLAAKIRSSAPKQKPVAPEPEPEDLQVVGWAG